MYTHYYRIMGSTQIEICVSMDLPSNVLDTVERILAAFAKEIPYQENAIRECVIYLEASGESYGSTQQIIVQESDPHWIFDLIQAMERFIVETLNCTVLHGTCVIVKGECLAIIGERMSGKTTLAQTLLEQQQARLVGDDTICLMDNCVFGLQTPLLMRSKKNEEPLEKLETMDDAGQVRTVYWPKSFQKEACKLDYLIFPRYDACCAAKITRLKSSEVFSRLMSNVRHHQTIGQLYYDVLQLANVPAYEINYPSQKDAIDLLRDLCLIE